MSDPAAPRISAMDRRLAWAHLARVMFDEDRAQVELDGHRLLDVLGRGAMATVYRAHDPTLEREVAIKVIERPDSGSTLQEARALAKLNHPGVVTVHRVGELDGQVYIVMERLRGPVLRAWQHERPWPEIVAMYVELARALGSAHRQGIVHRDFKPENVRIDEHGRGRILDFGLAGALDSETRGGTPAYVAPEQLAGLPADPAMDQFAWAVALTEALTGTRPRPGSITAWPAGADAPPSRLASVLERALQRAPEQRWPSLDAAADALERAATVDRQGRGRELLLDELEATWIAGVLRPLRRERVQLRPALSKHGADGMQEIELGEIDRLLAHAAVVVLRGAAGSGKTTVLLELAELAEQRARRDASASLPVVLNLSSWSTWPNDSLRAWLLAAISIEYGIPAAVAQRWLDDGALLLLLDGLDEIAPSRRAACVRAIAKLRAEQLVGLAVACRVGDEPNIEPNIEAELRPALTIELQPLEAERLHALLELEGRTELVAALARSPKLATLLRSPLLVDMALRCVDDVPELTTAPNSDALLHTLARRLLDRQLAPLEQPSRAQLRARLSRLARLLARQGLSELWLERMQPSWLPRAWQRGVQALASVVVVAAMLATLVALTLVPAAGLRVGLASAALAGPVLASFVAAALGLRRIETVERLSWSWTRAWASRRPALGRALGLAAILSLIASAVWGVGQPLAFALAIALSNLLGYALLFTLMLVTLSGLAAELVTTRARVNAGIRASGRNMLLVWGLVALVLALPLLGVTLVADGLPVPDIDDDAIQLWRAAPRRFFALIGVCAALTLGCVAGLLRGGFAVVQHLVLRMMLAIAGELPLRLGRLLGAGCSRSLLRRVGGGHAFMHGALQAELARESEQAS